MSLAPLADPEFWARWVAIMVLNLTLSGDNALVIALAVRHLPRRQAWQGRVWGTLGAVILRVAFTVVVALLLRVPLLQTAGACLLVWIAIKLLTQEEGGGRTVRHGASLVEAVWIIVVADVIMSLDNVLAVAAAARDDILLIVLGVGLSIPIVVWGAGLLARLMGRFTWIVDVGAGILGWVAGEMMLKDEVVRGWIGARVVEELHWALPALVGAFVIAVGRGWIARRAAVRTGRDRRAER